MVGGTGWVAAVASLADLQHFPQLQEHADALQTGARLFIEGAPTITSVLANRVAFSCVIIVSSAADADTINVWQDPSSQASGLLRSTAKMMAKRNYAVCLVPKQCVAQLKLALESAATDDDARFLGQCESLVCLARTCITLIPDRDGESSTATGK